MPWWAVGISIRRPTSPRSPTWLRPRGPAIAIFATRWSLFIFPVTAVVVSYLFIPFLPRLKVYTIYEYLEHRFGVSSGYVRIGRVAAAPCLAIAIAIDAVALALQQIVGWHVGVCVALVGGLTTHYTVFAE